MKNPFPSKGRRWPRALFLAGAVAAWVMVLAPAARAAATERAVTLEAIHDLENPGDRSTPGRNGELGAYQFRESTWRSYTNAPFSQALDRTTADEVAARHYEWLKSRLMSHGIEPTAYNIALAWNAGLTAVVNGHTSGAAKDYARRASNLAADFRSGAAVAAK